MDIKLTKDQEKALLVLREAGGRTVFVSPSQYAVIRPQTGVALHKKGLAYLRFDRSIRLTDEGAAVAAGLKSPADDWDQS